MKVEDQRCSDFPERLGIPDEVRHGSKKHKVLRFHFYFPKPCILGKLYGIQAMVLIGREGDGEDLVLTRK